MYTDGQIFAQRKTETDRRALIWYELNGLRNQLYASVKRFVIIDASDGSYVLGDSEKQAKLFARGKIAEENQALFRIRD